VKVPGSELARVLLADSLRGANGPGSEKAVNRIFVGICRYAGTACVQHYIGLTKTCLSPPTRL